MKRVYRRIKENHFELIGEFPGPDGFSDYRKWNDVLNFTVFPNIELDYSDSLKRDYKPELERVQLLYDKVNGYEAVASCRKDIEDVILEYGGTLYNNYCDVHIL